MQLLIFLIVCVYFFYTRIWKVYSKIWYYSRQGVVFHNRILPFIGSYSDLAKYAVQSKNHPIVDFCQDYFFKGRDRVPNIVGTAFSTNICLIVNRPEPAEEIFLSKNKYFDKHPTTGEIFKRTAGDSIVFARSDL
jgi:hypothetical protein